MNGMGAQLLSVHLRKIEQRHRVQVLELEPRSAGHNLVRLPRQSHALPHARILSCTHTRTHGFVRVRLPRHVAVLSTERR